jgi:hypothetical protein
MTMKKSERQGWAIIGVCGTIFALLGALAVYANVTEKRYDPETLCPNGCDYPAVRILVDKTDPWDAHGSGRLEKIIRNIKNELAVSERLSISVLDQSGSDVPTPVFDMCNPGRGDQANSLYKNPRKIHEKFEAKFDQPLERMLADLLKPGTAPRSPLIEAIQNFPAAGPRDRLVLVSDLMQNSELFSFYRDSRKIPAPNAPRTISNHRIQYDSITVYFIDRHTVPRELKERVITYWRRYLGQMTLSLVFDQL